jgi:hypothetical protein
VLHIDLKVVDKVVDDVLKRFDVGHGKEAQLTITRGKVHLNPWE